MIDTEISPMGKTPEIYVPLLYARCDVSFMAYHMIMSLPADEMPDTRVWSRLESRVAHRKPSVSILTTSVMHHSSTDMSELSSPTPKRVHHHRQDPTLLTTTPGKPVRKDHGDSRFLVRICEQGSVTSGNRRAGQMPAIEQVSVERQSTGHETVRRKEYDLDGKRIRKSSEATNGDQYRGSRTAL